MYTWGYIKDAALSNLNISENEANQQGYFNKFIYWANEVITQISSAVKPKHTFAKFTVYDKISRWRELCNKYHLHYDSIIEEPSNLTDNERLFWNDWKNSIFTFDIVKMPDDFVSFGADLCLINDGVSIRECADEDFLYRGDNNLYFITPGIYDISYNARWITFNTRIDNSFKLDIPCDILECIPPYLAMKALKNVDEYNSTVFKNEYEVLLARIDDTYYKTPISIKIGGDW